MPTPKEVRAFRAKNNIPALEENPDDPVLADDPTPPLGSDEADPDTAGEFAEYENAVREYDTLAPGEQPQPATAAPQAPQEPPTPPADTWTPPTKDEWDTYQGYKTRAEQLQQIEDQFVRAPETTLQAYYNALTPEQQQVFMQRLQSQQQQINPLTSSTQPTQPQAPTTVEIPDYDPAIASGVEKLVHDSRDWLANGPAKVQQFVNQHVNKTVTDATTDLANRAQQYIDYRSAVLEQKIDLLFQLTGVTIPALDAAQVEAMVRSGKPVQDAVRELYAPTIQQTVAARKAADKPTPKTPGNTSGGATPQVKRGASMADIAAQLLNRPLTQ